MVELHLDPLGLNAIFGSLADPTRRDILRRVAKQEMSVSDIAKPYKLTFAAISKHLKVLENAKLILKRKQGKEQMVQLAPATIKETMAYLTEYEKIWNNRLDRLEQYLATFPNDTRHGSSGSP
jgi:DNA-binding transcriptional ArsR family regulator